MLRVKEAGKIDKDEPDEVGKVDGAEPDELG